ncbi:hypothetical protein BDA96_08G120600 [Sorghum bicolor]|uniref:Uncharacterized protein n=1 Tax=Sorghum bicolor TaxID=4558 RepID=A0A921QFE5_SORBI|nr:hypothetical protein BDA96_08G120600 [Sorghum bicolor]
MAEAAAAALAAQLLHLLQAQNSYILSDCQQLLLIKNKKQRSNRTRFELLPARNLNSSNAWLQAFNRNTRYELNRLGEAVDSARKKRLSKWPDSAGTRDSGHLITASPEPPSRRYVSVATVPALVGVSDSFWAPMLFWG